MTTITLSFDGTTVITNAEKKVDFQNEIDSLSCKKNIIIDIGKSKFYLPNYEEDLVQGSVYNGRTYFEFGYLLETQKYLPKKPTIIDIGANIGNHTLFWANECSAKKIYAFEPMPYTFKILKKNIKINNLQERVQLYNIGLSEKETKGVIKSFDKTNIGGTRLTEAPSDKKGNIKLKTLDSFNFDDKKIDLIKIDVEGMDYLVLTGAIKTIKKYKPLILIESFPEEYNITKRILLALGYKIIKEFNSYEYLYAYDK